MFGLNDNILDCPIRSRPYNLHSYLTEGAGFKNQPCMESSRLMSPPSKNDNISMDSGFGASPPLHNNPMRSPFSTPKLRFDETMDMLEMLKLFECKPPNNNGTPMVDKSDTLLASAVAHQNLPCDRRRYKTEMCRKYMSNPNRHCEYGDKCQYAHGLNELRLPSRHPKYKTDKCTPFHSIGICPYGRRCDFIHNETTDRLKDIRMQVKLLHEYRKNCLDPTTDTLTTTTPSSPSSAEELQMALIKSTIQSNMF